MKKIQLLLLAGLMTAGVSCAFADNEKPNLNAIPEQAQFNENKPVKEMMVVPAPNAAQPVVNPAAAAAANPAANPAVNPAAAVGTWTNPAGKQITNHGMLQSGKAQPPAEVPGVDGQLPEDLDIAAENDEDIVAGVENVPVDLPEDEAAAQVKELKKAW
ncbi:MAG: hypothetical protein ACYC5N_00605 [Endomicrobiales bacterium]